MEKKKNFNMSKIGKAVSILGLVTFLNCGRLSADTNANKANALKYPNSEKIEFSLNGKNANTISNFKYKDTEVALNDILNSQLNTLTTKSLSDAEVSSKLAALILNKNNATMALSDALSAQEDINYAEFAEYVKSITPNSDQLLKEEFSVIVKEKFNDFVGDLKNKHDDKRTLAPALSVTRTRGGHDAHLWLETEAMILERANKTTIFSADETDGYNQFVQEIQFNSNQPKVIDGINSMLPVLTQSIFNYSKGEFHNNKIHYNLNANEYNNLENNFQTNINSIKNAVIAPASQRNNLKGTITDTAKLLSEKVYGNINMRTAIINVIASDYALVNMLTKLQLLGYNVEDLISPEILVKNMQNTSSLSQGLDIIKPGFSVNALPQFIFSGEKNQNSLGIDLGLRKNYKLGENSNWNLGADFIAKSDGAQILGNAGIGYTKNNANLGAELQLGTEVNNDGKFGFLYGVNGQLGFKVGSVDVTVGGGFLNDPVFKSIEGYGYGKVRIMTVGNVQLFLGLKIGGIYIEKPQTEKVPSSGIVIEKPQTEKVPSSGILKDRPSEPVINTPSRF